MAPLQSINSMCFRAQSGHSRRHHSSKLTLRRFWRLGVTKTRLGHGMPVQWICTLGYSTIVRVSSGHPVTRWIDQLENFAGGDWQHIALDAQHCFFLQEGFVTHDRDHNEDACFILYLRIFSSGQIARALTLAIR